MHFDFDFVIVTAGFWMSAILR